MAFLIARRGSALGAGGFDSRCDVQGVAGDIGVAGAVSSGGGGGAEKETLRVRGRGFGARRGGGATCGGGRCAEGLKKAVQSTSRPSPKRGQNPSASRPEKYQEKAGPRPAD